MQKLHKVTFLLLLVGGLNWLLLGAFDWEIGQLFGGMSAAVSRVIYILVGLSAVNEIVIHKKACRFCKPGGMAM
ncbi:MAG: DUF378 domain-containing protein [Candidatus Sungbacteria bacterium]|nr:DUF378 domain-containing protein [Candidatus Sungbacteria bacterium]